MNFGGDQKINAEVPVHIQKAPYFTDDFTKTLTVSFLFLLLLLLCISSFLFWFVCFVLFRFFSCVYFWGLFGSLFFVCAYLYDDTSACLCYFFFSFRNVFFLVFVMLNVVDSFIVGLFFINHRNIFVAIFLPIISS